MTRRFDGVGFPSCSKVLSKIPKGNRDNNGFYRMLGLLPWCSNQDIRKAYLVKIKEFHPDIYGQNDEFHKIQFAKNILTTKRVEYDSLGENQKFRVPWEKYDDDLIEKQPHKEEKPNKPIVYSYYYENNPNHELATLWYNSLLEWLPRFGFSSRLVVKLSNKTVCHDRFFEVPYHKPNDGELLFIAASVVSKNIERLQK